MPTPVSTTTVSEKISKCQDTLITCLIGCIMIFDRRERVDEALKCLKAYNNCLKKAASKNSIARDTNRLKRSLTRKMAR